MISSRLLNPRPLRFACVVLISLAGLSSLASAQTMAIEEFVERKGKWSDLQGVTLRLEGRYSVIGNREMRFQNCDLPFILPPNPPGRRNDSNVVEVSGEIVTQQGNKLAFRIESLTPRMNDLDALQRMRYGIKTEEPDDWYRVADWARKRGRFYQDQALLDEARKLDRQGVLAEFRKTPAGSLESLRDLLEKARSKSVGEDLVQMIIHERLHSQLDRLNKRAFDEASWRDLAATIGAELKGALTPLESYPEELATKYNAQPRSTYEAADEEQRRTLHRLFYIDIMTRRILADARADGENGFTVADRLRGSIPERKPLIAAYEQKAIDARMEKIGVMTRASLIEFTSRLEQDNRSELATEAKKKWLAAREPILRQEGARGLNDLAKLWLDLLGDREAATQFSLEALAINPDSAPAKDWLLEAGYVKVGEQWMPASEIPVKPKTETERAIEQGRPIPGMTTAELRAALGVLPTTTTRIATANQSTEIWFYEAAGIVVELSKPQGTHEVRVVSVHAISSRPKIDPVRSDE